MIWGCILGAAFVLWIAAEIWARVHAIVQIRRVNRMRSEMVRYAYRQVQQAEQDARSRFFDPKMQEEYRG